MYPWIWLWAPQIYFPWSGSVAQKIEPSTSWFFDAIDPSAGDGRIERRACEIASYGRQLGLITEVLLDSTKEHGALSRSAEESGIVAPSKDAAPDPADAGTEKPASSLSNWLIP